MKYRENQVIVLLIMIGKRKKSRNKTYNFKKRISWNEWIFVYVFGSKQFLGLAGVPVEPAAVQL